jgi:hypothetical protein
LYLWYFKEKRLRVIEGNYDDARFDDKNVVLGVSKGVLNVFQISTKELEVTDTQYKLFQKVELEAHYDNLTFIEYSSKYTCRPIHTSRSLTQQA